MLLFSRLVTPHGAPRWAVGFALESAADMVGEPGRDRMADALVLGVEIAQDVEGATGSPVALLLDLYGPWGLPLGLPVRGLVRSW
jgi:hypothetical protein